MSLPHESPALAWPQANLMPGGLSITGPGWSLKTLVGSCVAVMVWDEARQLAGMCHFVLPERGRPWASGDASDALDGRYGAEALQILTERMGLAGSGYCAPVAHVVGGAALLAAAGAGTLTIGQANAELALAWVQRQGLHLGQLIVGGSSGRRIEFNTSTGALQVMSVSEPAQQPGLFQPHAGALV